MYKTQLNLYCQKVHVPTPCYKSEKVGDEGFVSVVSLGGSESFQSLTAHSTKKAAEDEAAGVAVRSLVQQHPSVSNIDEILEQIGTPTSKKQFSNLCVQANNTTSMPLSSSVSAHHPAAVIASRNQPAMLQTPVRPTIGSPIVPANIPTSIKPPPGFTTGVNALHRVVESPSTGVSHSLSSLSPRDTVSAQLPPPTYQPNIAASVVTTSPPLSNQYKQAVGNTHVRLNQGPPPLVDTSQSPVSSVPSSAVPIRTQLSTPLRLTPTPPTALISTLHPPPPPPLSLTGSHLKPSSPALTTVSVRSCSPLMKASFHDKLVCFCSSKGLADPDYHCIEAHGRYKASVFVGGRLFSKPWQYDSFDDAKQSAAMMALAELCFQELNLSPDLRVSSPATRQVTSLPLSVPGQANKSPLQSSQTTGAHSHLQPPSYFNQTTQPIVLSSRSQSASTQQSTPPTLPIQKPGTPYSVLAPLALSTEGIPPALQLQTTGATSIPMEGGDTTHKQALNTYCQQHHLPLSYECIAPEDTVGYIAVIHIGDKIYKSIAQPTKRAAEAAVAYEVLRSLGVVASRDPSELRSAHMQKPPDSLGARASPQHRTAEPATVAVSYKNLLQEHLQKHGLPMPHYETERSDEGFVSCVNVHLKGGHSLSFSSAPSPIKKGAEQDVARKACTELHLL